MQTNYIKKDILMISALFIFLVFIFGAIIYYDMQANVIENWSAKIYELLISR